MSTVDAVDQMREIHKLEIGKLDFWFNVYMRCALVGVICIGAGGLLFGWSHWWSITLFVVGLTALGGCYYANSRRNYWNDRVTNRLHRQLAQIFTAPAT